jgi:hypothetical protein
MIYKNKNNGIINISKYQGWNIFIDSFIKKKYDVNIHIGSKIYILEWFETEEESQLFINFIYDSLINDKDNATYTSFEIWRDEKGKEIPF